MATRRQPKRAVKNTRVEEKPEWHGGPPEISSSEINVEKLIGEGSFGKVFAGTCRGSKVAIKVPAKQLSPSELQDLRQEVSILSSIFHPNVVLFMGACTKEQQLMIVTELKDCSVEALLKRERDRRKAIELGGNGSSGSSRGTYLATTNSSATSNSFNHSSPISSPMRSATGSTSNISMATASTPVSHPLTRLKFARDTCLGTNWLHNISHIIHRDLKTANLLYDESSRRVCVTDFGLSQTLAPDSKAKDRFGPRGSALFMAPEVIREQEFDHRVDTYSFGIVLWELWTCEEPFGEFYDFETFVDSVHVRGLRPPISSENYNSFSFSSSSTSIVDWKKNCPPKLVDLMKSCWADSPTKRPKDFQQILSKLDSIIVDYSLGPSWPEAAEFWFEMFCKPKQKRKGSSFAKDPTDDQNSTFNFMTSERGEGDDLAAADDDDEEDFEENGDDGFLTSLVEKVTWNEFILALEKWTGLNRSRFECIAPFILSADGKFVTIQLFADVVEWFGYWFHPVYASVTLAEVNNIADSSWFCGAISRQQAESHINNKETCPLPDSFLVRLSASVQGYPFTITRPSHSTKRPNLRVKRSLASASYTNPSSLNMPSTVTPFVYAVDYGNDGCSPSFSSLTELIRGLSHELRLKNAAPYYDPNTGGY